MNPERTYSREVALAVLCLFVLLVAYVAKGGFPKPGTDLVEVLVMPVSLIVIGAFGSKAVLGYLGRGALVSGTVTKESVQTSTITTDVDAKPMNEFQATEKVIQNASD